MPQPPETLSAWDSVVLTRLQALAQEKIGLEWRPGRESMLQTRLARHMQRLGVKDTKTYLRLLNEDKSGRLMVELLDMMTTNHTSFLREANHFDVFRDQCLGGTTPVSVWCAASSTGEEPYSIAMTACAHFATTDIPRVSILATDISTRALQRAEEGVYKAEKLESVPLEWRHQYFLKGRNRWAGYYRVRPEIRRMVRFDRVNLVEPFPELGEFQAIFCRNVMIYFDKETRMKTVRRLANRLAPGGFLFVGHAESALSMDAGLEYVSTAAYRRRATGRMGGAR